MMKTTPVVNKEALLSLKDILGEQYILLLEKFLETTDESVDDMERAMEASDVEALKIAAHSLKGGARQMGADRLGDLAFDLEQKAGEADLVAAGPILSDLIAVAKETTSAYQLIIEQEAG
jgi:HPt (histidine-containing phosphotransfer) domain-containing protein